VRLLLDTHALLWWLSDNPRLRSHARTLIADPDNDILVSTVSLWEIAVKTRVGKMRVSVSEIAQQIAASGFTFLDITIAHLETLATLPVHHRDPFDHLLIAQAIAEAATLMTEDRNIGRYPVQCVLCTGASSPST
jgi:PIN domain nuclease of toxin-antitoxin system